jgi:hypothetical protein
MSLKHLSHSVIRQIETTINGYVEESQKGPRPLRERERLLKPMCQEICALLLAEDAVADRTKIPAPTCKCGHRMGSTGLTDRTLVTIVCLFTYRRRYYECTKCGYRCHPLDNVWEIESGSLSPEAKQVGVEMASALTFREAYWWWERMIGLASSVTTLWRATQEAGEKEVAAWEAAKQESQSRSGAAKLLERLRGKGASGRWGLAVDGGLIRIGRKWQEVKLAVLGPLDANGEFERGGMSYVASTAQAEEFRQQVVRHACERGVTRQTLLALLSDGAAWIGVLATRFFTGAIVIRDWWHAVQYLWQASAAIHGEGTQETQALVKSLKALLWKGDVKAVRQRLEKERTKHPPQGEKAAKAYREAIVYLENQEESMQYKAYRDANLPIGSGPAEAGVKTVIQTRMKRSGMNWGQPGAQRMLFLRAKYCSRLSADFHPQL